MSKRKTHAEFINELLFKNPTIECVGEYQDARTRIPFMCKTCGYEFLTTPDSVLRGSTCAKCKGVLRNTKDEFISKLQKINTQIEVVGEYVNNRTAILCKCNHCGNEWFAKPTDLLRGTGCPNCYHRSTSFVEQCIFQALSLIFGEDKVVSRDKTIIGKELDIVIPSKRIAVEFGSWHWHKTKFGSDVAKVDICKDKNINLLVIYDSYDGNKIEIPNFFTIGVNLCRDDVGILNALDYVLSYFDIDYSISDSEFHEIKRRAYENSYRKSTEEFIEELKEITGSIRVLGSYKTAKEPINCECLICHCKWSPTPDNLLRGQGCPDCGRKSQIEKNTMTYDEFIGSLGSRLNPNVKIIKKSYVNTHSKVECVCNVCGFLWGTLPTDLRHGAGCPRCAGVLQKTHNEFMREIDEINTDIEILGEYVNNRTPILARCKLCSYEWKSKPNHLLSGHGCPKCAGVLKRSIGEMQEELDNLNFNIKITGEYQNTDTPIVFQCEVCGHEWSQIYRNLLKSRGCPMCFHYTKAQDEKWFYFYNLAKRYHNEHGNLCISARTEYKNEKLGRWVYMQRRCYRNSLLPDSKKNKSLGVISKKRIDLLNDIDMTW